jgi:List-Bact-rpt repeat protein
LINRATRILLMVVLVLTILTVALNAFESVGAQAAFDFSVSLNGYSLSLAPNHSGYVQVTVALVSGSTQNVTLASEISPQDGEVSAYFAQPSGNPSFLTTLVVNAAAATPGKTYTITITGMAQGLTRQAPPLAVTILQASSILTTTYVGQGSISPSCPSGCPQPVGQVVNVTASPAAGWKFSGWNITGASCSGGLNSNPCMFTMPNNAVSANANYVQYQTLTTTYMGQGTVSPSCPTSCQVFVGSTVSIAATPSPGWIISGYHVTNGVTCGAQPGFTCTFTMPSFPVSFQVTFTETTLTSKTTITTTYSITTPVTSTSVVGSTATSTITIITESTTQLIGTQTTTVLYSTSNTIDTQSQYYAATQLSIVTSTTTSTTVNLPDPLVELGLAATILVSTLVIGANVIKQFPKRGVISCSSCGFKNSHPGKYCLGCGEPLKRT